MRRLLAIAVLALTACQTPPKVLPYPPQRVFQNTYSFMPPAELDWRVLGRDAHQLAFVRPGVNPDETFAIEGRVFRLPASSSREEFVEIIKKGLAPDPADARFKVLKHETSADTAKEPICLRSHFVAEDHAAVKRTATPGVMILETMLRFCAHPKYPNIGVRLGYSHRRYPEHADASFTEKADRLLSSLEFLE